MCCYVPMCRIAACLASHIRVRTHSKIPEMYNLPSLGLKIQCRVSINRNIRAACGHPVSLPPSALPALLSCQSCQPSVRPPSLPAKFDSSNKYKLFEYYVSFLSVKLRTLCAGLRMRRQSLHSPA